MILPDSGAQDDETPLIDMASDTFFMSQAMRQAQRAYREKEVPVGAVIVHQGRSIIARAHNQVETLKDARPMPRCWP